MSVRDTPSGDASTHDRLSRMAPLARAVSGTIVDGRRKRGSIPPADRARLDDARAALARETAEMSAVGIELDAFCDKVDSGEMLSSGVILDPLSEEDSLVQEVRDPPRRHAGRRR